MKFATGPERRMIKQMDPWFMSEEDGEDNQAGSWVVMSPPWRSPQLSLMLKQLQQKVDSQGLRTQKIPRVNGEQCTYPPPSSPQWALATADRQEDHRSPSTQPLSSIVQSPLSTPGHDIDSSDDNNDSDNDTFTIPLPKTPTGKRPAEREEGVNMKKMAESSATTLLTVDEVEQIQWKKLATIIGHVFQLTTYAAFCEDLVNPEKVNRCHGCTIHHSSQREHSCLMMPPDT
ncbi:hypothetical protein ACROYT_G014461 [Oculina patagonica]